MGSHIEVNDTLRISKDRGFLVQLKYEEHVEKSFTAEDFKDVIFEFRDNPGIRVFHRPPVRIFLVENIDGKWLYWGQIHVIGIKHDYINETTSGKYKIIYINTPEEMKTAFDLINRNPDTNYFA